jgi:hypothetical protein
MANVPLDKFYTKISVAKKCIKAISDIEEYDTIIEPSAGSGAFSSQIKNCISYDIQPEANNIIKQDFLELKEVKGNHILFIGNPPFGIRSSLAKKFIKHCRELNAETIAFILPNTFSKIKNQSQELFPRGWRLTSITNLGNDGFEIDGETYHVPCSFYIWTRKPSKINLRQKELPPVSEFKFLPRESNDADFVLNGNCGKVRNLSDVTNSKSEHYIKITNSNEVDKYKKVFKSLDFRFESSCNGGVAWISQQEILEAYYKKAKKYKRENALF